MWGNYKEFKKAQYSKCHKYLIFYTFILYEIQRTNTTQVEMDKDLLLRLRTPI